MSGQVNSHTDITLCEFQTCLGQVNSHTDITLCEFQTCQGQVNSHSDIILCEFQTCQGQVNSHTDITLCEFQTCQGQVNSHTDITLCEFQTCQGQVNSHSDIILCEFQTCLGQVNSHSDIILCEFQTCLGHLTQQCLAVSHWKSHLENPFDACVKADPRGADQTSLKIKSKSAVNLFMIMIELLRHFAAVVYTFFGLETQSKFIEIQAIRFLKSIVEKCTQEDKGQFLAWVCLLIYSCVVPGLLEYAVRVNYSLLQSPWASLMQGNTTLIKWCLQRVHCKAYRACWSRTLYVIVRYRLSV